MKSWCGVSISQTGQHHQRLTNKTGPEIIVYGQIWLFLFPWEESLVYLELAEIQYTHRHMFSESIPFSHHCHSHLFDKAPPPSTPLAYLLDLFTQICSSASIHYHRHPLPFSLTLSVINAIHLRTRSLNLFKVLQPWAARRPIRANSNLVCRASLCCNTTEHARMKRGQRNSWKLES